MVSRLARRFLATTMTPSASSFRLRTHNCGELTAKNEGEQVCIMGWLAYKRMDRFLVLRDRHGSVQATVNPSSEVAGLVKDLSYESVVKVEGVVRSRGKDKNEQMKTGEIEIDVSSLTILNKCDPYLPFDPNGNASEKVRLNFRYLDIRGNRLQNNLRLRAEIERKMSRFLEDSHGFEKVETPTLFRRTPGGAAEFLVPCGPPNVGSCYSLPQSPQQHKQLLMVGGWDRYFQIARCYRDEGSKGDRQPEFTQVDMEMSFTNQDEVLGVIEGMVTAGWPDALADLRPTTPFPRISFEDAMRLYGVDKPDMRIPWIIEDASEILEGLKQQKQREDWCARLIVCRGAAETVTNARKSEWKRLIQMNTNGRSFDVYTPQKKRWFKFVENAILQQKYNISENDAVVFCWGDIEGVQWTLGQLRNMVAEAAELRKERNITCHWIVDFPLFTVEDGRLVSTHHPFTAPIDEHRDGLLRRQDLRTITGQHYDLVINGVEMGGGSIRIHNPEEQRLVLEILQEDPSEMAHLIDALSYGAPPHGGFALGLDRFVALMAGEGDPSVPVRDVIAFPKTKEGRDLMCDAPVPPSEEQMKRYGVAFPGKEEEDRRIIIS